MKKNISMLAIILMISMLTACSNETNNTSEKYQEEINMEEFETTSETSLEEIETEKEPEMEEHQIIDKNVLCKTFVTHDYPVEQKIIKITSKEEWDAYKFKDSINWNEINNAFPEKTIFIIQGESGTGSIQPYISEAIIDGNVLNVIMGTKYPEIGTCDMAGVFYVFICDSDIEDIIVNNNPSLKDTKDIK